MHYLRITFVFFLCAFAKAYTSSIYAQTIQGSVQDEQQQALPFVNVILNTPTGELVKATVTAQNGQFRIANIKTGSYSLRVSYLGYTTLNKPISVSSTEVNLGVLTLAPEIASLDNVTIIAEKPVVEVKPDRTVFNVSASIGSAGVNGLELLRKAPGVRLDNSNAVIVEGKTGVLVYIDGRQSYLEGDDLTAYLQSLQADTIESIEIITQPSSRYDAAGNAGIINIILKREKGLGTKGSVSSTLTVGDYMRTNNAVSLNARQKNWVLYGTYSNYLGRSTGFIDLFRIQGNKIFDAQTDSEYESFSNNFRLGADYYLSQKSTLGAVMSVNVNDASSWSNSTTPIIDRNTAMIDSILRAPNSSSNQTLNFNTNVNYRFKDTLGQVFAVDLDYGRFSRDRFNNQPNIYVLPNGELLNQNNTAQETPTNITILAGRLDYEQPLGKGSFEAGVKGSQVLTDNSFRFFDVVDNEQFLNSTRSNQFDYDEKIYAAYIKYNTGFGSWKLQGGLRIEHTDSQGDLTANTNNEDTSVSRTYTNLFPSAGVTYQLNRINMLAVTYSRRIQRPNYQVLNPFEFQIDELSFRKGNPFLQPQYTQNVKLSHTYKYTLTTSLSYSYVTDFFAQVTEAVGENRNFLNTRNVANQEVYNLSISYPFKVNDWWSVYGNLYGSYNRYIATNPAFISTSQETFGGYLQNTFKLPKSLSFEVSGWFSSPSIWGGTYQIKSLGSLNLAVQKKWQNWTARLTLNDVLFTSPWQGVTQFGDLFIDGRGGSDSRNVNFYLQYTFGNKDVKEAQKRSGSLDDEKKRIGR